MKKSPFFGFAQHGSASIMLQIAEKVKERRLELNLTQSALAKRSEKFGMN